MGHFTLQKIINLDDLHNPDTAKDFKIEESDLCVQDGRFLYQHTYHSSGEQKYEVTPGSWTLLKENGDLVMKPVTLKNKGLLKQLYNSQIIHKQASYLFDRLDVFKNLGEFPARKLLFVSEPGMGKTATITEFCNEYLQNHQGTVVIFWPISSIDASGFADFLEQNVNYTPECERLILIIEDIGGAAENGGRIRAADPVFLNMMDGARNVFTLPTLVLATTNHPENLAKQLADRPGRFDDIIKLKAPKAADRILLAEFIAKRDLTEDEKSALSSKKADNFSMAHIKEVVIRSILQDKAMSVVIQELYEHSENFKRNFETKGKGVMGFGSEDDD